MSIQESYRDLVLAKDCRQLLDLLDNCLPFPNYYGLEVASLFRDHSGTVASSRWRAWKSVRDDAFLSPRVNQRSISLAEIVLDMDPYIGESKSRFQRRVLSAIAHAKDHFRLLGAFTTGSRGVHIHLLEPRLLLYPKLQRERIKAEILRYYDADSAKKTERCLILLEGAPNPKTGQAKRPILEVTKAWMA